MFKNGLMRDPWYCFFYFIGLTPKSMYSLSFFLPCMSHQKNQVHIAIPPHLEIRGKAPLIGVWSDPKCDTCYVTATRLNGVADLKYPQASTSLAHFSLFMGSYVVYILDEQNTCTWP